MSAPYVTDSMREWAEAYVNAARVEMGEAFDADQAQAAIRHALLNRSALPDLDPVTDDHSGPVDDHTADRAAASNYPEGVLS